MDWMLMPLRRYADFEGRSRRTEYWMFVLLQLIVLFIFAALFGVVLVFESSGGGRDSVPIAAIAIAGLATLCFLGMFIPTLAVQVRRMHDQNQSGWMILLGFIPYLGGIVMLVFMCIDGTPGPNRFGPDPKGRRGFGGFGYGPGPGYPPMPPQGYGPVPPYGPGPAPGGQGPGGGYGARPPQP